MIPAGVGPLALLDLPDPCVLGSGNDVAMYGLAARLLTPSDAPAEWNEPTPVACLDLRQLIGMRLDATGLATWERRCNEVLGQDTRASSVTCSLILSEGIVIATVSAIGAEGPFSFVLTIDRVSATILRTS